MPHLWRLWPVAVLLAALACSPPDEAVVPVSEAARTAPPPRLGETAQFDAALAGAEPDALRLEEESAALAARAEALRARAAALQAPVVDPSARPRLAGGGT
jgi:hypothetical protein